MGHSSSNKTLWSKRVLLVCWICQDVMLLAFIAFRSHEVSNARRNVNHVFSRALAIYSTSITFAICSIIVNAIEALWFLKQKLSPVVYLISQLVKITLFTTLFVVKNRILGTNSVLEITGSILLLLSLLAPLSYSTLILRRHHHLLKSQQTGPLFRKPAPIAEFTNQDGKARRGLAVVEDPDTTHQRTPSSELENVHVIPTELLTEDFAIYELCAGYSPTEPGSRKPSKASLRVENVGLT